MECPGCQWESLPGTKACPVCGHSFDKQADGPTYPPRTFGEHRRQGALNRLFARLNRRKASLRLRPKKFELNPAQQLKTMGVTFLGIVPGLGHFVMGMWRWGLVLAGAFVILSGLTPLFWRSWISNVTGLLAILIPLFSMGHAGGLASRKRATRKDSGVLILFPLMLVLLLSWRMFNSSLSIVRVTGDAFAPEVKAGEHVVLRKDPETLMHLKRGDLVHFSGWGHGGLALRAGLVDAPGLDPDRVDAALQGRLLGHIVGLPGEHLAAKDGILMADDTELPKSLYPVWNPTEEDEITLEESEYLVVSGALASIANVPSKERMSTYRAIRGKAVAVLLPTSARRFLE